MICDVVASVVPIGCSASAFWSGLASVAAIAAACVGLMWAVMRAITWLERAGAGLAALAALALGFAAGLPERADPDPAELGSHSVVLLDMSESVWRNGVDPLLAQRDALAGRLEEVGSELPSDAAWSGRVLRFDGAVTSLAGPVPFDQLGAAVRAATFDDAGRDTDITQALDVALNHIVESGTSGSIWMLSDGWSSTDGADRQLERAQAMGVAIHTLGYGAETAGVGLISSDIGPVQWAGIGRGYAPNGFGRRDVGVAGKWPDGGSTCDT